MKQLSMDKALVRRRILRINVGLGLLVFTMAFFFMVTGDYSSLSERKAADSLLNYVALGGVLYAAFAWMFCVMSKPFWFPSMSKSEKK